MPKSTLRVRPHIGACGATVTGARLDSALAADDCAAIVDAWHRYGVVAFPGQHLSDDEHAAFSRRLGLLEQADIRKFDDQRPAKRFIQLANVGRDGETVTDPDAKLNRFLQGNQYWHSDSSFKRVSAKASLLAAHEVPTSGGETEFADMRDAYDALDPALQQRIEGMIVVHSANYSQRQALGDDRPLSAREQEALPPARHPLVRTHEPTGRRSLFIGRHAWYLEGLDQQKSRDLLDQLLERACQPPRTYVHRWAVGDLVLWDNRCMLHRGRTWDFSERRVMRRTTVAGDPPPGEANEWAISEE